MENNKLFFIPAQISFHVRRDDAGRLLENGTSVCIKADTAEEAYRQYVELKNKIESERGKSKESQDEEKPLLFPGEGLKPCIECGGAMVIRTAKNGSRAGSRFLGCNLYPECRYTEPVEA